MQPTVEYLGYRIDAQGMHAIEKKNYERMLYELHTGHAGIVRMKSHARLHVWWRNLDRDIATVLQKWGNCQRSSNKPQPSPQTGAAESVHRFAGPFMGKMFLCRR